MRTAAAREWRAVVALVALVAMWAAMAGAGSNLWFGAAVAGIPLLAGLAIGRLWALWLPAAFAVSYLIFLVAVHDDEATEPGSGFLFAQFIFVGQMLFVCAGIAVHRAVRGLARAARRRPHTT